MTERDFLRFHQLLRRDAGLFHFIDDLQNQVLRALALFWIDRGINAEQSWVARRVGKRRDAKGQAGLFPHAPIQARAAAVTQNRREHIERGNVRMRELGNVPSQ